MAHPIDVDVPATITHEINEVRSNKLFDQQFTPPNAIQGGTLPTALYDKEMDRSHECLMKPTAVENAFTFSTFVIMGTAAMAFWNTFIASLYSLHQFIYLDQKELNDTIVAVYTTMSLISTAILIRFHVVDIKYLVIGGVGFIISALGVALTCQMLKGVSGVVLLHFISGLGGSCTALYESSMFGFASIMPRNYVGGSCLGLGLSGLLAFIGWMLCSKVLFPMSTSGVKSAVWLHMLCTAAVHLIAIFLFLVVYRRPWALRCSRMALAKHQEKDVVRAKEPITETSVLQSQFCKIEEANMTDSSRTRWDVFKDSSEAILNVSFTLFLTFLVYPNIAPFGWKRSVIEVDWLMGIWQFGDFIGRYIPNLRFWFPFAVVKPKTVKYFTMLRILFLPLFLVMYKLPQEELGFLGTFWFQAVCLFVFVFFNGWICSLSSMYVPDSVRDNNEKGQAATMYLLCLLLGITLGGWISVAMIKVTKN